MKPFFILQTFNNNYYIFNFRKKIFLYCHPILVQIFLFWKENKHEFNVKNIAHKLSKYNRKTITYYYNKFRFLFEAGFFEENEVIMEVDNIIIPEMIKKKLANAKQITFEVTESCNLNCKYCGYGDLYWNHDERTYSELDENVALKFLQYLKSLWDSPLNISHQKPITISFYGGEPLLNFSFIRRIVDFIDNLDFKHNRINYGMTTNGILLDQYIEFLIKHEFYLLISLDGDKEHNIYRQQKNGANSFEKVYKNVLLIKKNYPDYFKNNIMFNSVLHNRNNIEDVVTFFDKAIGKIPRISQLNNIGIRKDKTNEFSKMFNLASKSASDAKNLHYVENRMKINFPGNFNKTVFLHFLLDNTFWSYDDLLKKININHIKRIPTGTCFPFDKKIFITAKGKILPCERIGHQYSLGNVNKDKINLNLANVAKSYEEYYSKLKKQCEKCYFFEMCLTCIFNIENLENNPKCKDFADYDLFQKYLTESVNYFENHPELYEELMRDTVISY